MRTCLGTMEKNLKVRMSDRLIVEDKDLAGFEAEIEPAFEPEAHIRPPVVPMHSPPALPSHNQSHFQKFHHCLVHIDENHVCHLQVVSPST